MEAMLKILILEVLPHISEDKRQEVVNVLLTQGIQEPEDLQYVNSSDLENILPPIQVRKAVAFFKSKYDLSKVQASSVADQSVRSTPTSLPAAVLCTSSIVHVNTSPACSYDWVPGFAIPWENCCTSFIESIDVGKPPKEAHLRELVGHVMSDVSKFTRKAPRSVLRKIAKKIVSRSPSAFADVINGKVISDGTESIMLMLESKKENMLRISKRAASDGEGSISAPRKKLIMSQQASSTENEPSMPLVCRSSSGYGCVEWQPVLTVSGGTDGMKAFLSEQSLIVRSQRDMLNILKTMEETYSLQRQDINSNLPVKELLETWPLLREQEFLIAHFEKLTGVQMSFLFSSVEERFEKLFAFCKINHAKNAEVMKIVLEAELTTESIRSRKPMVDSFMLLIAATFREQQNHLVMFFDEITALSEEMLASLPMTPFIIGLGKDVNQCSKYYVSVERQLLKPELNSFLAAFQLLFGSYFVFNLEYNSALAATLEYVQRDLMHINPESGSKTAKGRKKGVKVCPRIITFLKRFASFPFVPQI